MGSGWIQRCEECGFEFMTGEGVGFLFPMVYAETVQKAKDGELGKEMQTFFEDEEC